MFKLEKNSNTARRALWGKERGKEEKKKEKIIRTSLMGGFTENSGLFC